MRGVAPKMDDRRETPIVDSALLSNFLRNTNQSMNNYSDLYAFPLAFIHDCMREKVDSSFFMAKAVHGGCSALLRFSRCTKTMNPMEYNDDDFKMAFQIYQRERRQEEQERRDRQLAEQLRRREEERERQRMRDREVAMRLQEREREERERARERRSSFLDDDARVARHMQQMERDMQDRASRLEAERIAREERERQQERESRMRERERLQRQYARPRQGMARDYYEDDGYFGDDIDFGFERYHFPRPVLR